MISTNQSIIEFFLKKKWHGFQMHLSNVSANLFVKQNSNWNRNCEVVHLTSVCSVKSTTTSLTKISFKDIFFVFDSKIFLWCQIFIVIVYNFLISGWNKFKWYHMKYKLLDNKW